MRAVATADASSSSSAAGSRTQAACRIELRFIALGALESKGGVATPGPFIRPARFFGKGNRLGPRCPPNLFGRRNLARSCRKRATALWPIDRFRGGKDMRSVEKGAGYCIRRTDTDSDLPPPGITRVSLNREHYYANPNPLAVSASKSRGTVSVFAVPTATSVGDFRQLQPPPDWVAPFYPTDVRRSARAYARIADAVKVSSNRSLVKERGGFPSQHP